MASLRFFDEQVKFRLPHPRKTANWIKESIIKEGKRLIELNFIFCTDDYLHQINVQYLKHRTLTDIITFDHGDDPGSIRGEIYISIDRVRANAAVFHASFDDELHRVLIHGVLHLSGYSDKSPRQKATMRKKEDAYLSLRS